MANWGPGANRIDTTQTGDGKKTGFNKASALFADIYNKLNNMRAWRSAAAEPADVIEKEFWYNESDKGLYRRVANASEIVELLIKLRGTQDDLVADMLTVNGLIIDARKYGIVGDGTTDVTTLINNAITSINAAGGGVLLFPKGVYKITGIINLKDWVSLIGLDATAQTSNEALVKFEYYGTGDAFKIYKDGVAGTNGCVLKNFFVTDKNNTGHYGLNLQQAWGCRFDNIAVYGFEDCIWTQHCWYPSFTDIIVAGFRHYGVNSTSQDNNTLWENLKIGTTVPGAGKVGAYFSYALNLHLINFDSEGNANALVLFQCQSTLINGYYHEAFSTVDSCMTISGCTGTVINAPMLNGNAKTSLGIYNVNSQGTIVSGGTIFDVTTSVANEGTGDITLIGTKTNGVFIGLVNIVRGNTGTAYLGDISSLSLQVGVSRQTQIFGTSLTSACTVTVSTTGAYDGAVFTISKISNTGQGVTWSGITIPGNSRGVIELTYTSGAGTWALTNFNTW